MRLLSIFFISLVLACVLSALGLCYVRNEGEANSDWENSWVVDHGPSAGDIYFSRPLPPPHPFPDPRMESWRRNSYGLPIQWLVKDHAPDGSFYYARVDVKYAEVSIVTSFILSLVVVGALARFLRPAPTNSPHDAARQATKVA
jgi:hypothetical protein